MSKEIKIADLIFERLQKLAKPLIDTPETVIRRLLDHYESSPNQEGKREFSTTEDNAALLAALKRREHRQRGAVVKIGETTIRARSLSELYAEVLKYLYENGNLDKLKPHLPWSTSRMRYLIAGSPVHPNGNGFVVPVEYKGYYMEASKDYKNGIPQLSKMLAHCGLKLIYCE